MVSDDGGLLPSLFRDTLASEEVLEWRILVGHSILFWVEFHRGFSRARQDATEFAMEFELCSLPCLASNHTPKFLYLCSVLHVFYISSLCSGGLTVCECRHELVRCVLGARHLCAVDGNVHHWIR